MKLIITLLPYIIIFLFGGVVYYIIKCDMISFSGVSK